MRKLMLVVISLIALSLNSIRLSEAYDAAGSGEGFDKLVVLQQGVTYYGGLHLGQTFDNETDIFYGDFGVNTKIIGNGAVIDLQHERIMIAYTDIQFEILDCVIINGNLRFYGNSSSGSEIYPSGLVEYVTFYNNDDYAIRTLACGNDITIRNNIFFNAVNTGDDFLQYNSEQNVFLTTGANFAISYQGTSNPASQIYDNWSYFSRDAINQNPLYHFTLYCDYG